MANLSDGEVQTVSITNVPRDLVATLKDLADQEARPMSNFLRLQLERIVAEHKAREAMARR
jgi:hypothetical protein